MRVYMCICCYAGVDSDPFLFPKASPSALVAKGLAPVKGFLAGLCVGLVVKLVVPVPVRGGGAGASPRGCGEPLPGANPTTRAERGGDSVTETTRFGGCSHCCACACAGACAGGGFGGCTSPVVVGGALNTSFTLLVLLRRGGTGAADRATSAAIPPVLILFLPAGPAVGH